MNRLIHQPMAQVTVRRAIENDKKHEDVLTTRDSARGVRSTALFKPRSRHEMELHS